MKAGANLNDVNAIAAMYADGKSAEEISEALNIDLECVKSFAPGADATEATAPPIKKGKKGTF